MENLSRNVLGGKSIFRFEIHFPWEQMTFATIAVIAVESAVASFDKKACERNEKKSVVSSIDLYAFTAVCMSNENRSEATTFRKRAFPIESHN